MSIVEIYEQVERLPIEETLQALHRLIYSVGTMLMQLGEKEQGFVGWLQHKWKYLPIAIVIVIMRIAKYYWGSQHSNMSTLYGSSDIGSPFPAWAAEQGGVGDAGLHDMSGDMRIAVQRENAGVIVGLT
ncbi:hypothetical protein EBZ39_16255 [bacterium]|nr:hypothetical protein [bacterium]